MMDLDRALAEITEIRHQLARGTEFRGYGPATLAATGMLAAVAAIVQAWWLPEPAGEFDAYLALWSATAAISVLLVGWETITRSRRIHSDLAQEMIWSAVEHFLPAVAAGVLLTAVLIHTAPDSLWMLPGLWQVAFSLGVFASWRFLPRPIVAVGIWYLATGLGCLVLAKGEHIFSPWAMGGPYGLGQLLVAAILQWSFRAGDEQS